MLKNFASNRKNKGEDSNKILNALDEIQHFIIPQDRSKYSSMMIKNSL